MTTPIKDKFITFRSTARERKELQLMAKERGFDSLADMFTALMEREKECPTLTKSDSDWRAAM